MPNWCMNEVNIHGEEQEIKKFKEECFSPVPLYPERPNKFQFQNIIPSPYPQLDEGVVSENGEYPDWATQIEELDIEWRNENWGTKWDVDDVLTEISTDYIKLEFDTAWSPPDGIYNAIVDKYPTLDVNWFYREENTQMSGWL